jgi:tetratricopeptide (TPR) repeat protein
MRQHRPIFPLPVPFLWGVAVLLLLLHSGTPAAKSRLNGQSLALLVSAESAESAAACPDYITTLAQMRTPRFATLDAQAQLDWLLAASRCWSPERLPLLAPLTSERQWVLGQYEPVCDLLLAHQAPDRLLRLATADADSGKWEGVEAGLGCIGRFPADGAWVSPFLVAPLYNRLGQQYEADGRFSAAITAWEAAGDWYPVVWADPYLRKSDLLHRTGNEAGAIATLVDAVSRSTDATATFYLWRALRDLWQEAGNLADAACAADRALAVMAAVPLENLPLTQQEQFRTQRMALPEPDATFCFEAWPGLQTPSLTAP